MISILCWFCFVAVTMNTMIQHTASMSFYENAQLQQWLSPQNEVQQKVIRIALMHLFHTFKFQGSVPEPLIIHALTFVSSKSDPLFGGLWHLYRNSGFTNAGVDNTTFPDTLTTHFNAAVTGPSPQTVMMAQWQPVHANPSAIHGHCKLHLTWHIDIATGCIEHWNFVQNINNVVLTVSTQVGIGLRVHDAGFMSNIKEERITNVPWYLNDKIEPPREITFTLDMCAHTLAVASLATASTIAKGSLDFAKPEHMLSDPRLDHGVVFGAQQKKKRYRAALNLIPGTTTLDNNWQITTFVEL